jgi:hypothetical protein
MKMSEGQRFTIQGQPVKAENGTFEITGLIPQPDNDTYLLWQRVNSKGITTTSSSTNNLRGGRVSTLLHSYQAVVI